MDLVGRDAELAAIARAVQALRDGSSRAVAVVGEAGIGKSALLAEVAARADGLLVAPARAAEHERDLPFSLAADALASHARAIDPSFAPGACPPPPANAAERFRMHRETSVLVERLGPLVLLFDDVQWADDASLELILHLLNRPPDTPHLLVFALRPCAAATRLLAAARHHHGFEQLAPGPLDDAAACALLGDVADRERLLRDAAGNPLFLREFARSAAGVSGRLPATLQAAIEREVETLGEDERALLRAAAVAGDPFDPELAAAAAATDPALAPLDALVAADLLRPHPRTREFAFRHPLVRRAIYDAAAPGWRLGAHERAAAALAARGAPIAMRAYHVA
jgi:predicted ATPase